MSWLLIQMEVSMQWGVSHGILHEVVSPAVWLHLSSPSVNMSASEHMT